MKKLNVLVGCEESGQNNLGPSPDRDIIRAKTYPGIARAMAEQWGCL